MLCVDRDGIEDIAWPHDGNWIATACRDGSARILRAILKFDELLTHARTRIFRQLTLVERRAAMLPG